MCSTPNVVDMYIHSLRDKLDQGFPHLVMKTVRVHMRSAKHSAVTSSTGIISISIIGWNKITVASIRAMITCVGLQTSRLPHDFVEPFMQMRQFFGVRTTMKQKVS